MKRQLIPDLRIPWFTWNRTKDHLMHMHCYTFFGGFRCTYVTDEERFSKIERNGRKFCHIELSKH